MLFFSFHQIMEYISEPTNFHIVYYNDVIPIIKPLVEKQLSSIPIDIFTTCHNFRQFLNRIIDPIVLMEDSFNTLHSLGNDFTEAVWNDISHQPFQKVIDYIYHVQYTEQTPFKLCYHQLINIHSIQSIVSARVIHDCFIHYMKDVYTDKHQNCVSK